MINVNRLCMQCMKERGENEICPFCGYHEDGLQIAPYLAVKTWLMDRYLVGKMMTCDGEGVTYIGWDNVLQSAVLVREYLPGGLCQRVDGVTVRPMPESAEDYARCLTSFLEVNRSLARMRDLSALFPIYDIFELNGTAYAIAEYTESITMREFLHRNGDRLTFDQTRTLLMPAASTLESLHSAGVVHGGISPETMYIGRDGKVRFSGFAGRELRSSRGSLNAGLFAGYAAIEQYGFDGRIGPHTDVYALAGVFYRVISGKDPAEAKARMNQDTVLPASLPADQVPAYAVEALINALQIMPDNRTASVERFRAEFSAAPAVSKKTVVAPVVIPEPIEPEVDEDDYDEYDLDDRVTQKKSKTWLYLLIAMLITFIILGGLFLFLDWQLGLVGIFGDKEAGVSSIVEESEPTVSYIGGPVNSDPAQLVKEVPNYVGKQYPACASLEGSSFEVNPVNVHRVYSDTVAQDTVITQYPAAGTEVAVPAQVVLIVSMGSNKPQAVTPEVLIGQTYGTALATLLDAGYEWENIYVDFSDKSQNFDHIVATANINDKTVTLSLTAPAETPDPFAPDAY
ncbi:MAG: PASTA domain-containing protein [Clostridia bacterium]|nr:PASTA domain-containing protein [Clostridia bacterium]